LFRCFLLHLGEMALIATLHKSIVPKVVAKGEDETPRGGAKEVTGDARHNAAEGIIRWLQPVLELAIGIKQPTHPTKTELAQRGAVSISQGIALVDLGDAELAQVTRSGWGILQLDDATPAHVGDIGALAIGA